MRKGMPYTPKAQPGEAPLSVIRRGALGNGFTSTLSFAYAMHPYLDHSGACLGTLARSPVMLRATCRSMGLSEADIDAVIHERVGCGCVDDLLWNGLRVAPGELQFRRNRLCMACYVEHGYVFSEWDHVAAHACAEHHVLLDDTCPVCSAPWTWKHDPLSCGCDPVEVIKRQRACSQESTGVLRKIIETQDQKALERFTAIRTLMEWWKSLGIELAGVPLAEDMFRLNAGKWPHEETLEDSTGRLHPRVALAPLLASQHSHITRHAEYLLREPLAHSLAGSADNIDWPCNTATAVLGIGRLPFKKLLKAGVLQSRPGRRISAAEVNALLLKSTEHLAGEQTINPMQALQDRYRQIALPAIISGIDNESLQNGALSTRGRGCQRVDEKAGTSSSDAMVDDRISITDACRRLKTNPESVKGAIRVGLIEAERGWQGSPVKWGILRESLESFDSRFVFGSAMARAYRASVTTFSSRLHSAGIEAVSGPGIDTGVTYIFRRNNLEKVDIEALLKTGYQSPAGRKKKHERPAETADTISVSQIARILAIPARHIRRVVNQGWIAPLDPLARRMTFDAGAASSLTIKLKREFMVISDACRLTGQSTGEFRRTWIGTRFVTGHRFANQTLVTRRDIKKIKAAWEKAATANMIAQKLGRSRHLCANLKKIGRLKPQYTLGQGSRKVYLYPRNDPSLANFNINQ